MSVKARSKAKTVKYMPEERIRAVRSFLMGKSEVIKFEAREEISVHRRGIRVKKKNFPEILLILKSLVKESDILIISHMIMERMYPIPPKSGVRK